MSRIDPPPGRAPASPHTSPPNEGWTAKSFAPAPPVQPGWRRADPFAPTQKGSLAPTRKDPFAPAAKQDAQQAGATFDTSALNPSQALNPSELAHPLEAPGGALSRPQLMLSLSRIEARLAERLQAQTDPGLQAELELGLHMVSEMLRRLHLVQMGMSAGATLKKAR